MKRTDKRFEQTLDSIRQLSLDPEAEQAIGRRVWQRISDPGGREELASLPLRLESCDDYQALIGAYLADRLSAARRLLFEDHTRSCVPCRRALRQAKQGATALPAPVELATEAPARRWTWLVAAAAIVAIASWAWFGGYLEPPVERLAQLVVLDGDALRVDDDRRSPARPDDWIAEGETIHTLAGSSVILRLADGSVIEIGERSRVSVHERRRRTTVRVAQGDIIVQAAEQRRGTLDVATEDLLVSVRGTVFTVSRGAKGSRVGVIAGEVQVAAGRLEQRLLPGEQFASNLRLGAVPFEALVGWSQNSEHYLTLLTEMRGLRQELSVVPLARDLRYSTRLLDLVPAATVFYASLPNPGDSIEEVRSIVEERLASNEELRQWWQENFENSGISGDAGAILELLEGVAGELGQEIVVSVSLDGGSPDRVVVLTELLAPAGFEEALERQLEGLDSGGDDSGNFGLRFIVDPSVDEDADDGLLLWIADDLLVVSPSIEGIRSVAAAIENGSSFLGTGFYQRLAAVYTQGTELMGGVDIASALSELWSSADGEDALVLAFSGIEDVEHLVLENRTIDGISHTTAHLSFASRRRGMAAWLASPAPMASLDFVSVDATAAAAVVFKNPLEIIDELFDFLQALDPRALDSVAEVEAQLGVDLRADLAASLGGEAAFALDGALLPSPSWKWVVEVLDPRRLQQTIEWMVAKSGELVELGDGERMARLELSEVEANGRTYYRLTAAASVAESGADDGGVELEVHYTYEDGYLVAANSRSVLDRALQVRRSGYSLLQSPKVRELMPVDNFINFSGLAYQDFGPLLESLMGVASELSGNLTAEQRGLLSELSAESATPSLYSLYGEDDSIRLVATSEGTLLGGAFAGALSLGQLAGLGGLFAAQEVAAAP